MNRATAENTNLAATNIMTAVAATKSKAAAAMAAAAAREQGYHPDYEIPKRNRNKITNTDKTSSSPVAVAGGTRNSSETMGACTINLYEYQNEWLRYDNQNDLNVY